MLNVPSHQGNTHRSHSEVQLYSPRMAGMKITDHNEYGHGWGETGTLSHCWRKGEMVLLLWK